MKVSRTSFRGAAVAAAAGLLLSACGATAPGVAATVEGDRITDEQVDDFARVLCALGSVQGTESGSASKDARFASLQILLSNQLAGDVADLDAVPRGEVSAILQGMVAARDTVPEELRETFDDVAAEYARSQSAVIDLGRESLHKSGQQGEVPDDAAYAEGTRLLAEYAKDADIEIDPRFGELVDGELRPADGSLSVPVSELAVQGAAEQPGEALVSLLPASQKCESPS